MRWNLGGLLQLGLDELGMNGVNSTLESVSQIKVPTITYLLCCLILVSDSLLVTVCSLSKMDIFFLRVFVNSE